VALVDPLRDAVVAPSSTMTPAGPTCSASTLLVDSIAVAPIANSRAGPSPASSMSRATANRPTTDRRFTNLTAAITTSL